MKNLFILLTVALATPGETTPAAPALHGRPAWVIRCLDQGPVVRTASTSPSVQGQVLLPDARSEAVRIAVVGMRDRRDAERVLAALEAVPGVVQVLQVDWSERQADVSMVDGGLDVAALVDAVVQLGFLAEDGDDRAFKQDLVDGMAAQDLVRRIEMDRCLLAAPELTAEGRVEGGRDLAWATDELEALKKKIFTPLPGATP